MVINMECRIGMACCVADSSVDAIVTDPPYGLSKQPDTTEVLRHWLAGDDYVHGGSGFMGKSWDSFVPGPAVWKEAIRCLKPGGWAVVFAGSRTQDLMAISLRLAGFEIMDTGMWLYGSGFPKSMDISKAIDKAGPQGQTPFAEFAEHYEKQRKLS
ncbi:DNA methyltransferase, partial [Klebsiella pneumoniae]